MTVASMKKLEAVHHKWQRRVLGVVRKDKMSSEMVRLLTGMEKLEEIITKRRLRWRGHVHRIDENLITKQALNCQQYMEIGNEADQKRFGSQQYLRI